MALLTCRLVQRLSPMPLSLWPMIKPHSQKIFMGSRWFSTSDNLSVGLDSSTPRGARRSWEENKVWVNHPSRDSMMWFNRAVRHHIDNRNFEGVLQTWKQLKSHKAPNLPEYTEMLKALITFNRRSEVHSGLYSS
jgi:hypothetical protein